MGSQTDTHILDHNIVKTYEWNEWELRRKALKMVGLHAIFRKLHTDRVFICKILQFVFRLTYETR